MNETTHWPTIGKEAVLKRNHVQVTGRGTKTLMLGHGFGCDQRMWQYMLPLLENDFRIVLFDYVGSGESDTAYYDNQRYATLEGYAKDLIEICDALDLHDITFMGHSVSSIIGLLASIERPDLFAHNVMVCPSPCFINIDEDYQGGFELSDLEGLLDLMDKNLIGWANYLTPIVFGQSNDPALGEVLHQSFCSTDPNYLKPFARATFLSDYRFILEKVSTHCLIVQSQHDALAPVHIGRYMQTHIPNAEISIIDAEGHCLHMTHPQALFNCLSDFLKSR
jgi:sigma-B regulation protein RsbQ